MSAAAVLLGVIAALCWGVGDLLARFSSRGIGPLRTMFYGQMSPFIILTGWVVLDGATRTAAGAPLRAWVAAVACAPLTLCATYALLRAMGTGAVGVVVPIASSYGAVTLLLALLAGAAISATQLAGMTLAVLGLAVTATPATVPGRPLSTPAGVGWALLAAASYGVTFWLQGSLAVPWLGRLLPVWLYYLAGVVLTAAVAGAGSLSLVRPPRRLWPVVFGGGLLGAMAYVACAQGLATGEVAAVTVLSSLSSGVTALLGRIVLGERMSVRQWAGVAAILCGVALINGG